MELIAKGLFPALGFALSAAGLLVSFMSLIRKVMAERRYIRLLRMDHIDASDQRFDSTDINSEELRRAITEFEKATRYLSAEDQRCILESLHQESERGRARYADKLFDKLRQVA